MKYEFHPAALQEYAVLGLTNQDAEVTSMVSALTQFQLLDIVALKEDLPQHHLSAGQVGTLVEPLAPDVFEVDFSDDEGQTYAMLPLHTSQLLKLPHLSRRSSYLC